MDTREGRETQPVAALRRLVDGYQVARTIHVVTVLGIADLLADGPWSSDELAAETGSHSGALYRLLRGSRRWASSARSLADGARLRRWATACAPTRPSHAGRGPPLP